MLRSSSSSKYKPAQTIKERPLVLPEFDLNKYHYSPKIYQFIRSNFNLFNENRSSYIIDKKRKQNELKLENNKEKPSFKPSIFKEGRASNNNSKMVDISGREITNKVEKNYSLYQKQKESKLEQKRTEKELELMKPCTFKPVLNKSIDKSKLII